MEQDIRLFLLNLLKFTSIYMNGDTWIRQITMCERYVRNKRQLIVVYIPAFILIRLSGVWPFTMPTFACNFVSRNLLISIMKYFLALGVRTTNVIHNKSVIGQFTYKVYGFQWSTSRFFCWTIYMQILVPRIRLINAHNKTDPHCIFFKKQTWCMIYLV